MSEERGWDARGEILLLGGATVFLSILPFAFPFAPVPLAALVVRHGLKPGIVTAVLSGLVASFLWLSPFMLAQVLLILALGIALGEAIREGLSTTQTIVVGTGVAIVTAIVLTIAIQRIAGQSVAEIWQEVLQGMVANDTGVPSEVVSTFVAQMRATYPAGLMLSSLGLTVLDFALLTKLLGRLPGTQIPVQKLPPFGTWRLPRGVSLAFVVGWLLTRFLMSGTAEDAGLFWLAVTNAMFVLAALIGVHGLAVVWHFLRRMRIGPFFAALLALALYLIFPTPLLLVGLVDGWIDLRGLRQGGSHP